MSKLHCETYNENLGLRVRVKMVNLNGTDYPATEEVSLGRLTSAVAVLGETSVRLPNGAPTPIRSNISESFEICIDSSKKIPVAIFETHIETCKTCASRVELQLDFIENLELAVYQRQAAPRTEKVHGAMLVSAPKLNFAICGEIEPV